MPYKIVSRSRVLLAIGSFCLSSEGLEETFESLTISPHYGGVIYKVGKPTHPSPNCGPLAAFRTLKDVKDFQRRHGKASFWNGWRGDPVFRCRVKKETKEDNLFVTINSMIDSFSGDLPPGTILCKEITLTKLIP